MHATMQYDLMQARVAELHRQAECDRPVQAAARARRGRAEPRRHSRHQVIALVRRVLTVPGARTAPVR